MIRLETNKLVGTVTIPPSKSLAHRALILASLAKHDVLIKNIAYSNDILATIACLENLGIEIIKNSDSVLVKKSTIKKVKDLNCGESGSTLRFMIPYALLQSEEIKIDGENRLKIRPIDDYFPMFAANKVEYKYNGSLPITLKGNLHSGKYYLGGKVSSQFITGLLLTLPFVAGDSEVIIKDELESKPYVDMTIKIAKDFGIIIEEDNNKYLIKGNQEVKIKEYVVEGDYSQAAFFLVANALGADLILEGLKRTNMQGDEAIISMLESLGVTFNEHFQVVKRDLKPNVISLAQNPDLAPILGVMLANITGESKLIDLERLAYKESNRLISTYNMLTNCGVNVRIDENNTLVINGPTKFKAGSIESCNDHRIVMASAVLSLVCPYILIDEIKPVNKSFPNFFKIYEELGGKVINE